MCKVELHQSGDRVQESGCELKEARESEIESREVSVGAQSINKEIQLNN